MKRLNRFSAAVLVALCAAASLAAGAGRASAEGGPEAAADRRPVVQVDLEGTVNPGSDDYLVRAIENANARGAAALVIRIDTPGGMVDATRDIVKPELASAVPIIVWIGPAGARAGSAGVFISLAANVVGMAPATNIGAAHPVSVGAGGGEEKTDATMSEKILNDMVAWVQGIARQRGRNADWAADAVRKSVSVPADEAIRLNIADVIAPDVPSLLTAVNGRLVNTASGAVKLETANKPVIRIEMSPRERFLDALGNPNFAFLLIGLGILCILAELYHPGTLVPGVIGVTSLALGLLATRMLPVRTSAVVLMLVGAAFIAAEFFITSHGLLGLAGTVCLALGGFLLIDPRNPDYLVDRDFGVDWATVLPLVLVVAGTLALVVWKVTVARMKKPITGVESIVGKEGDVVEAIGPDAGKVFMHGELWEARSAQPIAKGGRARVLRLDGLVLQVEPAAPAAERLEPA